MGLHINTFTINYILSQMCTLLKNASFMYESRTTRIHCFRSNQSINNIEDVSVWCGWHRTAYAVYVQRIFSKMALRWRRGDELLNKVVIFIFLAYKKYSRRFIKLRLNHWWQTDYSDNALHTFLSLDSVIYLAVNGTVTSLPVFIQNILHFVPKTNKAFMGLERHTGN